MSPEVLKGEESDRSDEWSIGVLMYLILCGNPPFKGKSNDMIMASICEGKYDFSENIWNRISHEAKDLIKKLLTYDHHDRISVSQILRHPWFTKIEREGGPK